MPYSLDYLVSELKKARKQKGLSQRELGAKLGVPQSHLSKIEKGSVDIQASTLIELSRLLDFELLLVPRNLAPAFKAMLRSSKAGTEEAIPLYRLEKNDDD